MIKGRNKKGTLRKTGNQHSIPMMMNDVLPGTSHILLYDEVPGTATERKGQ